MAQSKPSRPSASAASSPASAPSSPAKKKPRRQRKQKNAFALPVRAADAPPIPEFAPVPRVYNRHDGWTPERQRAFIGALADTGCVSRAARMVNMAQTNCYTLRRAPGAEGFAAAWDAALTQGLKMLKDIAFERAIEGELVPVFAGGKLVGHRRKRNDALLMFVLRHYGEDKQGRRTTINYFSTRASAGAATDCDTPSPDPSRKREGSVAQASTTTVRTVVTGSPAAPGEDPAALLARFEGVELDAEAQAAILAALHDCAARQREGEAGKELVGDRGADWQADDPAEPFVPLPEGGLPYRGTLEPATTLVEVETPPGEDWWPHLGAEKPAALVEFEEQQARRRRTDPKP